MKSLKFIENIITLFKIKKFNKENFKYKNKNVNNKKIICELSGNKSNQVAFSYLLNFLTQKYGCDSLAYQEITFFNFFEKIKIYIQSFINYGNFFIYKSFQVKKFILVNKKALFKKEIENLILEIKKTKNKEDILNLKVKNILIGDLIYDSFLKKNSLPTLDIGHKNFIPLVENTLYNFFFWNDYFNKENVAGVIVSDTTYVNAVIARVACSKKINVYSCNWDNIHKIDENNLHAYGKFKHYKNDFQKLSNNKKINALKIAEKRMSMIFEGEIGVDNQSYSKKTSFHSNFNEKKILSKSNSKKIMIAAHCFVDAPHAFGPDSIIFPDFYEWLEYLDIISKKTNYEWYIKPHPHALPETDKLLNAYLINKPHFKIIPKNSSHLQIIKEGIDCVLTVYGTVSWEYAYFNIPVINASKNSMTVSYNFNLHAKNQKHYENLILNFENYNINYDKQYIHEFYFMDNFFSRGKWLLENYNETLKDINGYDNLSKLKFYDYWIKKTSKSKLNSINSILNKFINSDEIYIKDYNYFKK